ncbi:UNVERIFIED_CONTAM: Histone-lysine N-methyltransferase SUVR4 [Sesamum radiatum]|uniref:Histone-lysine N-methyltransferase SUVR4 n=1 Tax=Sesamum radiatum TaxID=300843 RepID=A0AAW2W131_SESRA
MNKKETKTRVANAFRAMKAIGISEDKVKPVLKSLLILYDKNWALIEEENYRALADAIFERDELEAEDHSIKSVSNEAAEQSKKKIVNSQTDDHPEEAAQATEEPERPLKRLRLRYRNGQTSSQVHLIPACLELHLSGLKKNQVNYLNPSPRGKWVTSHSRVTSAECGKHKESNASQALLKPKDEPVTEDMACLEVSGVITHPDASNGADTSNGHGMLTENCSPEPPSALRSVYMTPEGKGWGLRTLEDLPKGAFVCEYVGEVLTNAELFERVLRSPKGEKHSYPVLLDADWCAEGVLKDEEALCLDATYYGNVARFINHRCYDSNLVEIPVEVETPDHHYYHLAFFTTRKVKAMEELTWDYGIDFDDHEHPIKAFRCQCGSKYCRNIKRSSKYYYMACQSLFYAPSAHLTSRFLRFRN